MNRGDLESLGEPDLQIADLCVWIHGRQFPESGDYWDGNWLSATASCRRSGSMVRVDGSIIHLSDVVRLQRGCERLYQTLEGRAGLDCIEPNLGVELLAEGGGHIRVTISITPDQVCEAHTFTDGFDQTYLPPVIEACKRILETFPVREADRLPA